MIILRLRQLKLTTVFNPDRNQVLTIFYFIFTMFYKIIFFNLSHRARKPNKLMQVKDNICNRKEIKTCNECKSL